MTEAFFMLQVDRLKSRFGAKNFDPAFIRVVGSEVSSVSEEYFRKVVDTWIGNRRPNDPPLKANFTECRLAFEKSRLTQESRQAASQFSNSLQDVLRTHYKVDSLKEAFEIERLKVLLGGVDGQGGAK